MQYVCYTMHVILCSLFTMQIHILKFTKHKNYQQFLPIFEIYIETTFCAPMAHRELLSQMQVLLESPDSQQGTLLSDMTEVLDLIFKFVVRSALLYAE